MKVFLLLLPLAAGLLISSGCRKGEEPVTVSLEKRTPLAAPERKAGEVLTVGIGSMITPKEGYIYYQQLLSYLSRELGMPVKAVDRESYSEINALLAAGAIDVAFVCGGPYVDGREQFGLEILVVPQVGGQTVYQSYLIVPEDSQVQGYSDLRGKTFAFADPKSNSGRIYPAYRLARLGKNPDTFFEKYFFTFGHDRSIRAVAERMVDGAAVDSLIWEYLRATDPTLTAKTRVVEKSPFFGIPPVVVSPKVSAGLRHRLRQVLLAMNEVPEGQEILGGMHIDRFLMGDDASYDSIREMRRFLAGRVLAE